MEITNRYFTPNIPNPNMSKIYDICIGNESTKRFSLDGGTVVVKLPEGDTQDYGILQNATEYNHEGITIELAKPKWTLNEDI